MRLLLLLGALLCATAAQAQRADGGDRADRNAERIEDEEADQQQCQHHPSGAEGRSVADRLCRKAKLGDMVAGGNVLPEEQHQSH